MTVKLDGAALQIEDGARVARPDGQALALLEPLAKDDLRGEDRAPPWRSSVPSCHLLSTSYVPASWGRRSGTPSEARNKKGLGSFRALDQFRTCRLAAATHVANDDASIGTIDPLANRTAALSPAFPRRHAAAAHVAVNDSAVRAYRPHAARHASDIVDEGRRFDLLRAETGLCLWSGSEESGAENNSDGRDDESSHGLILLCGETDDNGMSKLWFLK